MIDGFVNAFGCFSSPCLRFQGSFVFNRNCFALHRRRRHFEMSAIYHHRNSFLGWARVDDLMEFHSIASQDSYVTDSSTYQHVVSIALRMRRREFFSCLVMKKPNRATQEMHHEMLQITFYVSAQLEISRHNPAPQKMPRNWARSVHAV